MAYENWGSDATKTSPVTPASSDETKARINLTSEVGEAAVKFGVRGKDLGLEDAYHDLKVQLNLYITNENAEVWKGENVILWPVVDGTANNVENFADNYGSMLVAGTSYDCVVHLSENTENVRGTTSGDIPVDVAVVVYTAPTVKVRKATNITTSSATLCGELLGLGEHSSADVWFKWRKKGETWHYTDKQSLTTPNVFSATLSGLQSGTTYEFCPLAENPTGGSRGAVRSFKTITQPPNADFSYSPTSPEPGEAVSFDAAASSDPDGTIVSYDWTFGDGFSSSGEAVTHSYSTPGGYTVVLTVEDDDGATDSISKTVAVALPPAPPAKVIEKMGTEDAAENLANSDPESASETLEDVVVDNVKFAAEIADTATKIGLTEKMAPILNRMSTDKAADLLRAVYNLPESPEAAAELLEAMNLNKSTGVVQTFIDRGEFDYINGTFAHLSDKALNGIYDGLTVDQRGELYPELSSDIKDRISAELAPRFETSNLSISKKKVEPGETTTISGKVTNTGGTPSTYTVKLSIEGKVVESQGLPLDPGQSETVSFEVSRKESGTYEFELNGLTGSFDVQKRAKPFPWTTAITISVIIAAILITGVWYWKHRRKTGRQSPSGGRLSTSQRRLRVNGRAP